MIIKKQLSSEELQNLNKMTSDILKIDEKEKVQVTDEIALE